MTEAAEPKAHQWWDRVLFRHGEYHDLICPVSLDITGSPRVLTFGPFLTLEAGIWSADVFFEVCDDAARRFYQIEFGSDGELSQRVLPPGKPGRRVATIEHRFERETLAQIRFWVARAAFHGSVRFLGASVKRIEELGPPADA